MNRKIYCLMIIGVLIGGAIYILMSFLLSYLMDGVVPVLEIIQDAPYVGFCMPMVVTVAYVEIKIWKNKQKESA